MTSTATPASPRRARRPLAIDLAAAVPVVLGTAWPTWWLLGRPASYPVATALLYAALAGTILVRLPAKHPGPGIGAANRVTLLRAGLAIPVLALAGLVGASALSIPVEPLAVGPVAPDTSFPASSASWPMAPSLAWWLIIVSTVAMLLDGLDGRIARRTGTESDFGARFDMELDAALIMALSVLVWASGRAGAWVLLMGLMRYLFVAAGFFLPALTGALPESFRRKVVCVVQGVVLLVALGPIIPAGMATGVCALGLVALTWSFAVDVVCLLRAADPGRNARP